MIARINTVAFQGIDVLPIDVQAQVAAGLPAFTYCTLLLAPHPILRPELCIRLLASKTV